MRQTVVKHAPGILLFFFAVVIALCTYQDYGVGWDEPEQRHIGLLNYNYVHKQDQTLLTYPNRTYGAGFELPLIYLENWVGAKTFRDIMLLRHLATHIFFLLGGLAGYFLAMRLFKSQFLACLAFIMLVFSPRTYGHSFINSKDIPFMAMLPVVMLAGQYAFEKGKVLPYLVAGAVCGYMTSIRVMGVLPACIIVAFLVIDFVRLSLQKEKPGVLILSLFIFISGYFGVLYACFPNLWVDPVNRFLDSFANMAHFSWAGEVLINGKFFVTNELPWYYFPTWFGISNPVGWLIAGIAGMVLILISFFKNPGSYIGNTPERNTLFFLWCFLAPVCAVLVLHSVIYDDWRHLYFVYPAFLFMALYFLYKLPAGKAKVAAYGLCVAQVAAIGMDMVRIHPFHQVYFNSFVSQEPEYLRKHYEMDYWGCSYKQGIDFLVERQHDGEIKLFSPDKGFPMLDNNLGMLQEPDKSRVRRVDENDADYMITNYRWHPEEYGQGRSVYKIKVFNSTILEVFKLR